MVVVGFVLLAAVANPGGLGSEVEDGHWEDLGEDGFIWVPAEPPAVTSLPGEELGDYHNYSQTVDVLQMLAAQRPEVFSLHDVGTSVDGRTIWMMRVTGEGDASGRVQVLLDGAHHANEVIGSETLTRLLLQIHEGYDSDAETRALLEEVVIDVVPVVNPDSMVRIPQCSHYAQCRKNSNGVDLNRNYPANWGGAGSSSNPSSATYHGPAPLSEPEAQAIAALLDENDYVQHATMHSGIELLLWPYGYTTAPPPDYDLYGSLGDTLSVISGAPHGQTSTALYVASGTTLDYAYAFAEGWRPVSWTPEVYGGPGNAFNWWPFFNPQEDEEVFMQVVQPWVDALWHLVEIAPDYAPAAIEAPPVTAFGPGAYELEVTVEAAPMRPFLDASLSFVAGDAPVLVLGDEIVALEDASGEQTVTFTLVAQAHGVFEVDLVLDAGIAGTRSMSVVLDQRQIGMELAISDDGPGSPDVVDVELVLDAGVFDQASGFVQFVLEPSGLLVDELPFTVTPGSPQSLSTSFRAYPLEMGEHELIATAEYTTIAEGTMEDGLNVHMAPFFVHRPQLIHDRASVVESAVLEPFMVTSSLRNVGTLDAQEVSLMERIPPGFTPWFRYGLVPSPQDPLGAPPPDEVSVDLDGSTVLVWHLDELAPGGLVTVQYGVMPLLPGEGVFGTEWAYEGDFEEVTVGYSGSSESMHQVFL